MGWILPEPMTTAVLRKLVAMLMAVVVVISLVLWFLTRETFPDVLRIATGAEGGLFYQVGLILESHLEARTGSDVQVLASRGSVENRELLLRSEADLAILQGGAIELDGLAVLAPIYREVAHVVVRRDGGVTALGDLAGRRVVIGPRGSGMRETAQTILQHYRIELTPVEPTHSYFRELLDDPTLDAAIVTTGLLNPDLGSVLATGEYDLIPILDAEALAIRHRHFTPDKIPRGFYSEGPAVPPVDVPTVATVSFAAARAGVSDLIVRATLEAIYEGDLGYRIPTAIRRQDAAHWQDFPIHPASRSYFQPYSGLEVLANFMESLAALKELVFAFAACLYLLWAHWQRGKQREREKAIQADKDRLDVFLDRTMEIERAQIDIEDPTRLKDCLDQVTAIKLQALEELTHEELRGDVTFSIFLQQCGDLARKIQAKIQICEAPEPSQAGEPGTLDWPQQS